MIHGLHETPVSLLDVAVFIRAAGIGLARFKAVVPHQGVIGLGKVLRMLQLVHRRTQAVGLMGAGHTAQRPQRLLQTAAERLQALREADLYRFPVGVGQREVINQVLEQLALDRHAQSGHVGEIRLAQRAGLVLLRKKNLLGGPLQRPPGLDAPLQRAQLRVLELARMLALQVLEQGLGLQARVHPKSLLDFRPYSLVSIRPVTSGVRSSDLAG